MSCPGGRCRSPRWRARAYRHVGVIVAVSGLAFILVADARPLSPARLVSAPQVPAAATLYWPRPVLSNPTTIRVTNDNAQLFLEPQRDYVIEMPSTPVTVSGGVWIKGGRNLVVVGGEIYDDTPIPPGTSPDQAYGLYLRDQTGTVHLEGLWIHGRGIGQALVLAEDLGATVQVQHSRFETLHPVGSVHTDGIQTWAGPFRLRLFDVTIVTAGVGLQTQPHQFVPVTIDAWEYRRVNIRQTTDDAYALWRYPGSGGWWREIHENFWVKNRGNLAWPDLSHWNPGADGAIEGDRIRLGVPPGGDFVPDGFAGVRYTTPGANRGVKFRIVR